jgi:hypothetical protein
MSDMPSRDVAVIAGPLAWGGTSIVTPTNESVSPPWKTTAEIL